MVKIFPRTEEVTPYTKSVYAVADMERGIAALEAEIKTFPTADEALAFMEMLNRCYPSNLSFLHDDDVEHQIELLRSLFMQFPFLVCWRSVDPKIGLPSRHKFMPNASEAGAFLREELARFEIAGIMAKRHIAERKRRDKEKAEERLPPTAEEKARVEAKRLQYHRDVAAIQLERIERGEKFEKDGWQL
jgi:hypothetical protein